MADFAVGEYRRRGDALQAGMARAEIGALLLTSPADVFYVTGCLTRFWESPTRPWYVVVPSSGRPIAVIPEIGAEAMRREEACEIRTWPAPRPCDDGVSLLAETICEVAPRSARIGVPVGPETHLRAPLEDWAEVQRRIAPRRVADATDVLRRVREIKSEPEIARIRSACCAAGAAFDRVPEFARAGVPVARVFRDFQVALLQAGADWVGYLAGGAGSGGYADVISYADARELQAGDVLMLDTGAVMSGYYCDFDRNYSVGAPGEAVRRAQAALFAAVEAGLDRLRPGLRACDLHRTLFDALKAEGASPLTGRLGHGLGVSLTEWPSLAPHDRTELRSGMVLTLEPGVEVGPGRILVHEENVVVRDGGAELLSPRAPEEMPVLVA